MKKKSKTYDVIVVGAGHAGCEAALAAARMGSETLLITISRDTIGLMSCNPAIGGLAKGQLVKELDALGGEMARAIDATGIQFRILNMSKGPAVRSSRAQADRREYQLYMRKVIEKEPNLDIKEGLAEKLLSRNKRVTGIETSDKQRFLSKTVIITTGTFLNGRVYIGKKNFPAGRMDEPPANSLSQSLKQSGLEIARLKTCTPPRLDGKTIDFKGMEPQCGDQPPKPFSFSTKSISKKQLPCYLTYTNRKTHEVIRHALKDEEFHKIISKGVNPRYCPSIEEKIVRFPERDRHQLFIEPEGLDTTEYYANGLFTFLSEKVQEDLLHTICGLEKAELARPGYGIEYDYVEPTQLLPSLETKPIKNLFLAGQINGTTGYEEAAAQGLIAGINAGLRIKGKDGLVLDRSQGYIGVLIDDLVTKGTNEPYRMFTSRCEYRLLLREDNADLRLRGIGYRAGLVDKKGYEKLLVKKETIENELNRLKKTRVSPTKEINQKLKAWGTPAIRNSVALEGLLKRPEVNYEKVSSLNQPEEKLTPEEALQVEIGLKYQGFIKRQEKEVRDFRKIEKIKIPLRFNFQKVPGLSTEIREKLCSFRPISLGQASRISGVTPVAISLLMVYLKKYKTKKA